jgi:hypothetical protein
VGLKMGVLTVDEYTISLYFEFMNSKQKMIARLDLILKKLQDLYPVVYKRRYLFPELYASYQKQFFELQRIKKVVEEGLYHIRKQPDSHRQTHGS